MNESCKYNTEEKKPVAEQKHYIYIAFRNIQNNIILYLYRDTHI